MIGPCQCQEAHTHERMVKEKETEIKESRWRRSFNDVNGGYLQFI
jgi:hypothetical protein